MPALRRFCLYLILNVLLLAFLSAHAAYRQEADMKSLHAERDLVEKLGLTDLCLFTDARYTRNPGVADLHSPFQDHPMSLEHFPSGSIVSAPRHGERFAPRQERNP